MSMKIAMNGRDPARQWEGQAKALNEETERLLHEVSETLKAVRQFSEGTLVDEIVDLGDTLIRATTKLMEGMNKIFEVVDKLLSFFEELFQGSSESIQGTKNLIN